MSITCTRLTLALLLVGCSLPARTQPQRFRFDHVTLEDGLPGVQVRSILQDRQGFLWVGTRDGLGRYDGYGFTTFRPDPDDPHSISDQLITALHEDRQGYLWVGTAAGGLNRFDPVTGRFEHFRHDPDDAETLSHDGINHNAIYEDRRGRLWVVTRSGLDRLDPATGRVRRFDLNVQEYGLRPDGSRGIWYANSPAPPPYITEDRAGTLWVGTPGGGLGRFDPAADAFTFYRHAPDDPQSLISDHVTSVYEAPSEPGVLWVGTYDEIAGEGGLNRFEVATDRVSRYRHDAQDPKSLGHDWVGQVHEDRAGRIWVGTCGGGVSRFDPLEETFTRHLPDPASVALGRTSGPNCTPTIVEDQAGRLWLTPEFANVIFSLDPGSGKFARYDVDRSEPAAYHGGSPMTIYEDRSGILWLGGWESSLDKIDPKARQFRSYLHEPRQASSLSHYGVEALYEDTDSVLWVGTRRGGLNRFDRESATFVRYTVPSGAWVQDIVEDEEGTLWLAALGGVFRFDPDVETFARFVPPSDAVLHPGSGDVRDLHIDSDGRVWGATRGGLYIIDRVADTLVRLGAGPDDSMHLPSSEVVSVLEDQQGTIWVTSGSDDGPDWLSRYDGTTGRFTSYRRPESAVHPEPFVDRRGRIWLPSDVGLYRFDPAAERFDPVFTAADGLPDNGVEAILQDDEGWLWISTRNGLCRFDPETREHRTFGTGDGLQSNRFHSTATRLRSGELVFGGENGITIFHPREIRDDPHPPSVVLTGLQLFGVPLLPDPSGPLQQTIEYAAAVRLEHHQNDLTFQYVGLHFRRPEKIRYAYMLEGYEDDWREVGTQRAAIYPNLPPGDYRFRVRAANADGVWNEEGAALAVTVLPPWWRTWWAYGLYVLLLVAGVVAAHRIQHERIVRRERQRAERETEKLRAEAAEAWANYLQVENERQTQELEAARALQLSMLPENVPEHPLVEIAAHMQTATEVGGDYYDFHEGPDGALTLVIGDATGHGMQAGTMVTAVKGLFSEYAGESDLSAVLRRWDAALQKMHLPKLYMALALARLRGHTLEMVGAGMPPALIYRSATGDVEQVPLKGLPLGSPGTFGYRVQRVTLERRDTVVLMSDGFPELFGGDGQMLGYRGAVEAVKEVVGRSPEDIVAHLQETAKDWCDGQTSDDDITFIVLRAREAVAVG